MDQCHPSLAIPEILTIIFRHCKMSSVPHVCRLWREVFLRVHRAREFSYEFLFRPRDICTMPVVKAYMDRIRSGRGCRSFVPNTCNSSTFIHVKQSQVHRLRLMLWHQCGMEVPLDAILGSSYTTLVFFPRRTEIHAQQVDGVGRSHDFEPRVSHNTRLHFLIDAADYLEVCGRFLRLSPHSLQAIQASPRTLLAKGEIHWPNHPRWVLRGVLVNVCRCISGVSVPYQMLYVEEADRTHPFVRSAPHCVGRVFDFHDDCYSELRNISQPQ